VKKTFIAFAIVFGIVGLFNSNVFAVDIGIGAEYLSQLGPQLAGQVGFGNWGVQAAFTGASYSEPVEGGSITVSVSYLSLIAKYHIPIGPVKAYAGFGGIAAGVFLTGESGGTSVDAASGIASGQTIIVGADYKLSNLPIAFYGGLSYLNFSELEFEVFGVSQTFDLDASGLAVHLGVKLAFSLGGGGDRNDSDTMEADEAEEATEADESEDSDSEE